LSAKAATASRGSGGFIPATSLTLNT